MGGLHQRRSKLARTRGPNADEPENHPEANTPGWGKPLAKRMTLADLRGEHRVDMLRRAKECGRAAYTDYEVGKEFGVTPMTISRWISEDPVFAEALQIGRDLADRRVEQALFHRAVGYTYPSEEIKVVEGAVVRVPVLKHVEPNMTAMVFWLKNRRPDLWRDVVDHEHSGNVSVDDKANDPRALAMALLAVMREAAEAAKSTPQLEAAE